MPLPAQPAPEAKRRARPDTAPRGALLAVGDLSVQGDRLVANVNKQIVRWKRAGVVTSELTSRVLTAQACGISPASVGRAVQRGGVRGPAPRKRRKPVASAGASKSQKKRASEEKSDNRMAMLWTNLSAFVSNNALPDVAFPEVFKALSSANVEIPSTHVTREAHAQLQHLRFVHFKACL